MPHAGCCTLALFPMPMVVPRIIAPRAQPALQANLSSCCTGSLRGAFRRAGRLTRSSAEVGPAPLGSAKPLPPNQLHDYAQRMASRKLHACLLTPLRAACNWSRQDHWRTDMSTSQQVTSTVPRAGSRGSLAAKVTLLCRVRSCTVPRRRRLSGAQATWAPGQSQSCCSGSRVFSGDACMR